MGTPADEMTTEIAAADDTSIAAVVETPENEIQTQEIDFLDLPDSEVDEYFMKALSETPEVEDPAGDSSQEDVTGDKAGDKVETDDNAELDDDDADLGDDKDLAVDDKIAEADTADADKTADKADDTEKAADKDTGNEADDDDVVINALQDLEKILSPFKANGKDIQVENVDDAITLMKMGANYNKKMAALKPNLRFVKMLEQNDLLDEGKLTQLIDISKKNPAAMAKFIKDSGIDPDEVVAEDAADNYSPGKYKVNDSEIELDQVLDGIRGNESYSRTIDVVSNQWDSKSKEIIFNDPNIITVIDSQIQSGVFDKIMTRMETEKMLGKLNGVSDIVAYKQIGDALDAAGLLYPSRKSTEESKTDTTTQTEKPVDKALNARRKAAASTKQAVASKKTDLNGMNPLAMPDDEFEKLSAQTLFK